MVAEEQTHLQVLCPVIATHTCVGVYIHTYIHTYICSIYLHYYVNIQSTWIRIQKIDQSLMKLLVLFSLQFFLIKVLL